MNLQTINLDNAVLFAVAGSVLAIAVLNRMGYLRLPNQSRPRLQTSPAGESGVVAELRRLLAERSQPPQAEPAPAIRATDPPTSEHLVSNKRAIEASMAKRREALESELQLLAGAMSPAKVS